MKEPQAKALAVFGYCGGGEGEKRELGVKNDWILSQGRAKYLQGPFPPSHPFSHTQR